MTQPLEDVTVGNLIDAIMHASGGDRDRRIATRQTAHDRVKGDPTTGMITLRFLPFGDEVALELSAPRKGSVGTDIFLDAPTGLDL